MNRNLYIRDGLDIVETGDGRTVLISGNSLGFEIDDVARAVLSVCDGRTSGGVVNALKDRLPEEDICDALEELRSVGAIQVGVLQRFLCRWAPFMVSLLNPLENLFRWSIRGHGDGMLEGVNGRDLRVLLYSFSTDPSAVRIPAGIIRERIPGGRLAYSKIQRGYPKSSRPGQGVAEGRRVRSGSRGLRFFGSSPLSRFRPYVDVGMASRHPGSCVCGPL